MDLSAYRERFPILRDTTYLISHSLGAMPAAAEERMLEFARTWRERGIRAWAEGWWEMPVTVGDQIARIIGAPPGSTVMHQNVAVAEAIVISCFRPVDPGRNRVVYEEGNFPSVRYLYQAQPELEVVVVADDDAIVEAIDERTLLVPITHVLFKPELEYAEGVARFLTGTPNVPALYAATAGYDLIEEIGVDRIRENSMRQTQLLIDLLDAAGFDVGSPRASARRGGTVTVRIPEFEAVHTELAQRQILCDFRPDAGLRLGPHYYNTDDELRHAVRQITEILETGAYEHHLGAATARF